jgi:hypothetical protein
LKEPIRIAIEIEEHCDDGWIDPDPDSDPYTEKKTP